MKPPKPSAVGQLIKHWRERRRLSQLSLAVDAEISTRHLSFIETGCAQPSRDMVLLLARALEVPPRGRNDLLTAAGFAPVYRETALDAPAMTDVRRALEFILRQQELCHGAPWRRGARLSTGVMSRCPSPEVRPAASRVRLVPASDTAFMSLTLSVEREDGRLVRELQIPHERGALRQFLQRCDAGSRWRVETTGNWYWIVDEIEGAGCAPRLVLALLSTPTTGGVHEIRTTQAGTSRGTLGGETSFRGRCLTVLGRYYD